MKVLVTGANGFVGPHLVTALAKAGHEVVALGHSSGVGRVPEGVEMVSLDLMDREAVDGLDFRGIDGVVHLAGLAAVGPSFDTPLKYLQVNGGLEVNLYEAAQAQGAHPRFVVISSGSLYDPKGKLPLTEASPVSPSSPYAVSKITQEQMAMYYNRRGFESMIARPFNHIGPGQGEGFLVPDLAKQIAEAEKSGAKEIGVGNLSAKRDFTDVRDIVRGYVAILEKGRAGEVYNLCSGKSVSGQDILDGLLAHSESKTIKAMTDEKKMRPVDVPDIYGDHAKLTKDTGWEPKINLEQSLREALEDWRAKVI
jgi:GDP-4-dehydro-6-deoxy-D-mannose reductase